ncbi:hypothetical protein [Streptomyces sp. CA-179760]|uniref:hypothetical protein n=1 Tax=Streptomyces sp. CA-179760 TaxID=3240054 RepID=UPI003D8E78FD
MDTLLPNKSVALLRAALVTAAVPPPRDEQVAALERWIASATEAITDDNGRKLVRRFATWHHLRRLRNESAKRPLSPTQAATARAGIRAAVALLAWLHEQGTALGQCTQVHLDEWIDSGNTTRYNARGFIEWCRKNRHISKGLAIPAFEKLSRVRPTDEVERWAITCRLMHGGDLAIEDPFAGTGAVDKDQGTSAVVGPRSADRAPRVFWPGSALSGPMARVMCVLFPAQAAVRSFVVMRSIGWEVRPSRARSTMPPMAARA